MTRTVNGAHMFGTGEREMLRRMLWKVADFSGVEVLTYCLMGNHFHVLVRVPEAGPVSDAELLRRYKVLYPKPTAYAPADVKVLAVELAADGEEAAKFRARMLARMGDVSEFMKTLKQRYTRWFNRTHERFGTLWSERFKSVLVEGGGNALQTVAAYIDLNPVRAGLAADPKDYRFCGYAEAVAGKAAARQGLARVWAEWRIHTPDPRGGSDVVWEGGSERGLGVGKEDGSQGASGCPGFASLRRDKPGFGKLDADKSVSAGPGEARDVFGPHTQAHAEGRELLEALAAHRSLLFGKGSEEVPGKGTMGRKAALRVLEKGGELPKAAALRCRVRYFTDGAVLGSREFVCGWTATWRRERERKRPPKVNVLRGADWGDLAVMRGLRRAVFG